MRFERSALVFLFGIVASLAGCHCERGGLPGHSEGPAPSGSASVSAVSAQGRSVPCPGRAEVLPGLEVERRLLEAKPTIGVTEPCLTLVRVDPVRYEPRLLSSRRAGHGRKTLPEWASESSAIALVNASMYEDDDHSTGLLVSGGEVVTSRDNRKFGGFFAFDPVDPSLPPVAAFGRECAGFDLDKVRQGYRSIVQNYRLLDCDGKAIAWKDEKSYSAAAFGVDDRGRVVLMHARAPLRMVDFATTIAAPELGIRAAFYVEGGPEASLYVNAGGRLVEEIGSYETGFKENDDNKAFWPLPNVLGFVSSGDGLGTRP